MVKLRLYKFQGYLTDVTDVLYMLVLLQVWQENIFDVLEEEATSSTPTLEGGTSRTTTHPYHCRNERVWNLGLHDEEVCRQLLNPGFQEVFPILEPTLDHPKFRCVFSAFPTQCLNFGWFIS